MSDDEVAVSSIMDDIAESESDASLEKRIEPDSKLREDIDRSFEPVFVEYEPLEQDYELVGREFVGLELNERLEDWRKVIEYSSKTGFYEWFSWEEIVKKNGDFINNMTSRIEDQFIQRVLELGRHKFPAVIVASYKDPSRSSRVNQANMWRTEYEEVDRKIFFESPTGDSYIDLRFTSQGEVFFYRRREDG